MQHEHGGESIIGELNQNRPRQRSVTIAGVRVAEALLEWYSHNRRHFPWREVDPPPPGAVRDPWMVLVTEVMLQQTQTDRVAELMPRFLDRFPDPESCAAASVADLLRAWKGLGYNSRAMRLREAARQIVDRFGGEIPSDRDSLRSLPGIGSYTADAILCFAWGRQVPLVEVNISRVLTRVFFGTYDADDRMPEKQIESVASALMPLAAAEDWNQALMDFGSLVCTARRPACGSCPLRRDCLSAGRVDETPLFHRTRRRKGREPRLLGRPVRLWRGEIVEILRGESEGIRVAELVDRLRGSEERGGEIRRELISIIARLSVEGMIARIGIVAEGEGVQETDLISLPE